MNVKLVVGSILGIGSLGGAAGYYFLKSESATKNKDNTDSETKSSESLDTTKVTSPDLQAESKPAELPPAPKEPRPDSHPATSAEPEVRGGQSTGGRVGDDSLSTSPLAEDVQRAVET